MMFRILTLLGFLSSTLLATDKIQTVIVTIPVLHTQDQGGVKWAKIPHTGWDLDNPYYSCFLYSSPQVMFKNEHFEQDINLISAYQLTVDAALHEGVTEIIIRTDKAKQPEGHKMTVEEVVALAVKGIRQDFPDEKKYMIKISDQPFDPKKKR
jgi:hypothetical protein